MYKLALIVIAVLLCAGDCLAISEKDFDELYKSSSELRDADKTLNSTWKNVLGSIRPEDKAYLLKMQKEWIKAERDVTAREYMDMGYTRACAYTKASRRWAKTLEVYVHNSNLSQEDKDAGRVKDDDAFWTEDDENIPANCRAK